MNLSRTSGTPTILFALIFTALGWSQATINESKETAHVYVDTVAGSDSNAGTSAKPFKTISRSITAATANNKNGVGTLVTINPGTYREVLTIGSSKTTQPMTFQAAQAGTVIVSGADQWTGWQAWSGHTGVFTHSWSYHWGTCPVTPGVYESPITLRREMIFVNGAKLTQVLALGQLAPGTFYVDESHGLVYAQPAPGTSMSGADVEVSTRNNLLTATNSQYLVVRGITFAEANPCRDSPATVMVYNSSQILFDQDQFNWNNSAGLQLSGVQHFTVSNSLANHNGESGFGSDKSKNGLWSSDEADYNAWRGAQGAIYGWNSGGFHFFEQHSNTVNGATSLYNLSHGLHWDTDNENVTTTGIVAANNLGNGIFVEKSEGPVSIANAKACNNDTLGENYYGGVELRASTYVTITGSTIANNGQNEIPIVGPTGGAPILVSNYETYQTYELRTTNLTMSSNTIVGGNNEQLLRNANQGGAAWSDFHSTLGSDYNTWWNGAESKPFVVPVPQYATALTWSGWKSTTGKDAHSTYAQPAAISCPTKADAPDFWLIDADFGVVNVSPGGHGIFTLLLTPVGSFKGATTFAQFGASTIPGATTKWSSTSLTGSGAVTFTVNPAYSTPYGTYPLTFSATSGGVTRTVTVSLVVQ
jgi:Right handed beta helix region/Protein of unknown function (DUF1565)